MRQEAKDQDKSGGQRTPAKAEGKRTDPETKAKRTQGEAEGKKAAGESNIKKRKTVLVFLLSRGTVTRTQDPLVPNQMR